MVGWWKLGMYRVLNVDFEPMKYGNPEKRKQPVVSGMAEAYNPNGSSEPFQIFQLGPNELYFDLPNGCWKITSMI